MHLAWVRAYSAIRVTKSNRSLIWGNPVGTLENPIIVNGAGDEQYAGCTGYPADSHIVNWLTVSEYCFFFPAARLYRC